MRIELFKPDQHLDMINQWREKMKLEASKKLPPTGIVIFDDNGTGLSAGFLTQTDDDFCIFGDFIANMKANRTNRSKAVDITIQALEELALKLGFNDVMAITGISRLISRAKDLGYGEAEDKYKTVFKRLI